VFSSSASSNADVASASVASNSSNSSWDLSELVGASAAFLAMTTGGALALNDQETKQFHNVAADDDRQDGLKGRAPKRKLSNLRRRSAGVVTCYRTRKSENLLATSALANIDPSFRPAAGATVENIDEKVSTTTKNSRKYEVSVRALKGRRISMEDEYIVNDGGRFLAVFDGHGGNGVSRYLRETLYGRVKYFLGELKDEAEDTMEDNEEVKKTKKFLSFLRKQSPGPTISTRISALQSAFRTIDREVMMHDNFHYQGSTAVAVVVHEGEGGQKTLLAANIGDSRAVLSRRKAAVNLTRDHKPFDGAEKARILAMGEKVEWDGYVYRVRDLALSRAIGDRHAKPAVSGEVEISPFPLKEGDEFVVLASDGLWDVMSSQEAVDFVHEKLKGENNPGEKDQEYNKAWNRRHMSRFLANEAMNRGTGDNVCVLILWLHEHDKDVE